MAYAYANDAFLGPTIVYYPENVIAAACIYLAYRQANEPVIRLPWWILQDTTLDIIKEVSVHILSVYEFSDFTFRDSKKKLERSSIQKGMYVPHLFEDMFDDSKDRHNDQQNEIQYKNKEEELRKKFLIRPLKNIGKLFARKKNQTKGKYNEGSLQDSITKENGKSDNKKRDKSKEKYENGRSSANPDKSKDKHTNGLKSSESSARDKNKGRHSLSRDDPNASTQKKNKYYKQKNRDHRDLDTVSEEKRNKRDKARKKDKSRRKKKYDSKSRSRSKSVDSYSKK